MKITVVKYRSTDDDAPDEKHIFDEDDSTLINRLATMFESEPYESLRRDGFTIALEFDENQDKEEAKAFFNNFAEEVAKRDNASNILKVNLQIPKSVYFNLKKDEKYGYLCRYLHMPDIPVLLEAGTGKKLPLPDIYDPVKVKARMKKYDPTGTY